MRALLIARATVALGLLTAVTGPAWSHDRLSVLLGSWVVVGARLETGRVHAWQQDDPVLLGSVLNISEEKITLQGETCQQPRLTVRRVETKKLFADAFDSSPTAMGLGHPLNARVQVGVLRCKAGQIGPSSSADIPWFLQLDNDHLWLSWFDGVLLQFRRQSAAPK